MTAVKIIAVSQLPPYSYAFGGLKFKVQEFKVNDCLENFSVQIVQAVQPLRFVQVVR